MDFKNDKEHQLIKYEIHDLFYTFDFLYTCIAQRRHPCLQR